MNDYVEWRHGELGAGSLVDAPLHNFLVATHTILKSVVHKRLVRRFISSQRRRFDQTMWGTQLAVLVSNHQRIVYLSMDTMAGLKQ